MIKYLFLATGFVLGTFLTYSLSPNREIVITLDDNKIGIVAYGECLSPKDILGISGVTNAEYIGLGNGSSIHNNFLSKYMLVSFIGNRQELRDKLFAISKPCIMNSFIDFKSLEDFNNWEQSGGIDGLEQNSPFVIYRSNNGGVVRLYFNNHKT